MEVLLELAEKYLREIIRFCDQLTRPGRRERGITRIIKRMRQVLGAVAGRARTEDVQLEIDKTCEEIFKMALREYQRYGPRVRVFSEHGTYGDPNPQYLCAIDPFDGSGIFRRGLVKEWYSVVSFFDISGEPVCGGAADIITKELFLAGAEGVVRVPEAGKPVKVSASRKRMLDAGTVIAAYLMNRDYRRDWEEKAKRLNDKFPALLVWPNGGACIYHQIACGQIHAYLMFHEPRSEIDPGLAFAKAAGFSVVSVAEDGTYQPYRFEPGKQGERVPWFIAACTEELVQNIIEAIMSP